MSFETGGCISSLAHTHVVAQRITGRFADILEAAGMARETTLKFIKPGVKGKELTQSAAILSEISSYGCKLIQLECHAHERSSTTILSDDAVFELNKVYSVDIIISSADTKLKAEDVADVFRVMSHSETKVRRFPTILLTINEEFKRKPFSIRALEGREDDDLAAIVASRKSDFVQSYPIIRTEAGVLVARLKFTFFLTEQGAQDKTFIRLQKVTRTKTGKEAQKTKIMSYCGKVPIGSDVMGSIPSIHGLSWVKDKRKSAKSKRDEPRIPGIKSGQQHRLVSTGSFGTYLFERDVSTLNDEYISDLELGWSKRQISSLCGSICKCNPSSKNILAIGVIDENAVGMVYLMDFSDQLRNPTLIYETDAGQGLNSLSWSGDGLHLLITANKTSTFMVALRRRSQLSTFNRLPTKFALNDYEKNDYFGVFHPNLMVVFIVTSSDMFGVFEYNDQDKGSKDAYYRKTRKMMGGNGFCGIAISADGEHIVCPRLDGTIMVLKMNTVKYSSRTYPFYEVIFEGYFGSPTPCISIKCSMMHGFRFAMLDKRQVIRCYDYFGEPKLLCDNENDRDCTEACSDFVTLSWRNEILVLGGEDGFLHFWTVSTKDGCQPFTVKKRDVLSEKWFYTKKLLPLGSAQSMRQNHTEIQTDLAALEKQMEVLKIKMAASGNASAQRVDQVEEQIQKAVHVGTQMLNDLPRREESVPVARVREMVEQIL